MENTIVNVGLYTSYIMLILGVVLAVVFPLINSISQPKVMARAGVGVLLILVVFGIAYLMSSTDITAKYIESGVTTGGLSRSIGGALKMVYILMLIAMVGVIYTEFNKIFK